MRAFAPGRVNLLGEHTDYAGGLVLPAALGQGTTVTVEPAAETRISSSAFPQAGDWDRYVRALLPTGSFTVRIESDLPIGAGLASSASLCVATLKALGVSDPIQVAKLAREAEHRLGVPCGIMDPMAAALLDPGQALFLNCTTLETRILRLPPLLLAVIHSGVSHTLSESPYAIRVKEVRERDPKRWAHIREENERVRKGVEAIERADLPAFGRLMLESHTSLKDLFEVSCPELDALVERLRPMAYGAKLTGAGFGGAVVAVLDPDREGELRKTFGSAVVATLRT